MKVDVTLIVTQDLTVDRCSRIECDDSSGRKMKFFDDSGQICVASFSFQGKWKVERRRRCDEATLEAVIVLSNGIRVDL